MINNNPIITSFDNKIISPQVQLSPFDNIPAEMLIKIIQSIPDSYGNLKFNNKDDINFIFKSLYNFSRISKKFYIILNDPKEILRITDKLSHRFNQSTADIILKIHSFKKLKCVRELIKREGYDSIFKCYQDVQLITQSFNSPLLKPSSKEGILIHIFNNHIYMKTPIGSVELISSASTEFKSRLITELSKNKLYSINKFELPPKHEYDDEEKYEITFDPNHCLNLSENPLNIEGTKPRKSKIKIIEQIPKNALPLRKAIPPYKIFSPHEPHPSADANNLIWEALQTDSINSNNKKTKLPGKTISNTKNSQFNQLSDFAKWAVDQLKKLHVSPITLKTLGCYNPQIYSELLKNEAEFITSLNKLGKGWSTAFFDDHHKNIVDPKSEEEYQLFIKNRNTENEDNVLINYIINNLNFPIDTPQSIKYCHISNSLEKCECAENVLTYKNNPYYYLWIHKDRIDQVKKILNFPESIE